MYTAIELFILIIGIFIIVQQNMKFLSYLFFWLFKENETVIWLFSLLFLPGTFIHEFGHFIFAEGLGVRTFDFDIIPSVLPDKTIKLGGVQMEHTDVIRRTIVGIAPVLFGIILMWVGSWAASVFKNLWYVQALYMYVLFQISHTMFSSKKDMEGVVLGGIVIAILTGIVYVVSTLVTITFMSVIIGKVTAYIAVNSHYLRNGVRIALLIDAISCVTLWVVLKLGKKV